MILGAMSVFGGFMNGDIAGYAESFDYSNMVTVGLQIVMIVVGIIMIVKGSGKEKGEN